MLAPAAHPWVLLLVRAHRSQVPRGREGSLVHQDKENMAKMGYQGNQVFRALWDPKEPRENLVWQKLVFLGLREKRDQEGCLDLLDPKGREDCLAQWERKDQKEIPVLQEYKDPWGLQLKDLRVKMETQVVMGCQEQKESQDVMVLRGTRVNLESATA